MKRLLALVLVAAAATAAKADEPAAERAAAGPAELTTADPVCGMIIRKADAPYAEVVGGRAFWFCGENCHKVFLENQAKYAGTAPEAKKPAAEPAGPDDSAMKNSEWRGLLHTAGQVRQAAMTLMVLAATFALIVVLGGLVIFTAGLAPNAVARSSVATRDHPIRSFVIGTVVLGIGTLATVATKGILGVLVAPVVTAALLIGLAGVSEHLGRNLWHLAGKEGNRVGHILAGWTSFSLVSVVPLVGWFGFLPYYAAVSVGSFFSGLVSGGGSRRPEA